MTESLTTSRSGAPPRQRLDYASRVLMVTALLSLSYAIAGLFWVYGGRGFPFGIENDPLAHRQSVLASLSQARGALWVLALGLIGWAIGLVMMWRRRLDAIGWVLIMAAVLQAFVYGLLIPDGRLLTALAHLPILLAGMPFGWPPNVTISSQISWPVVHQILLIGLGALWGFSAVTFHRRATGACPRCGRGKTGRSSWTHPAAAARWGRWAVGIAVAVPSLYAVTRLAWAVGLPLGVSREFLIEQQRESPDIFLAGAFMALLAVGGGLLSLALVQRWGEVYPRWIPWLGGRSVRMRTVIIPATFVAFLITEAGISWIRAAVGGYFPEGAMGRDWGTVAPGILWPLWGLALAAATYAYYLRRRERCRLCGADG